MKTYKILILTAAAMRLKIEGQYGSADEIHSAIHTLFPDARRVDVLEVLA